MKIKKGVIKEGQVEAQRCTQQHADRTAERRRRGVNGDELEKWLWPGAAALGPEPLSLMT